MTIYGLKDLDCRRLHEDDIVMFHVKDKQGEFVDLKYTVHSTFLNYMRNEYGVCLNDAIFTTLGLDPCKFCSKYYGYAAHNGIWPCYKEWDFEAATNVVKALYTLIDSINASSSFKAESRIDMIWNGKELGYNDTDGGWKSIKVDSSYYSNPNVSKCSTTSSNFNPLKIMDQCTTTCRNPYHTSLLDVPVDKLKKISSQIKTIKEDNNSKLERI